MLLSAILFFGSTAVSGAAATGDTPKNNEYSPAVTEIQSVSQPPAVPAEHLPTSDFEMVAEDLDLSVEGARAKGVFTDYAGSLESEYLDAYPTEFTGIVVDPLTQTMTLHAKAELIEELTNQVYDNPVHLVESRYFALELEVGAAELARELSVAGFDADVTGDIETSTVGVTTSSAKLAEWRSIYAALPPLETKHHRLF